MKLPAERLLDAQIEAAKENAVDDAADPESADQADTTS